MFFFHTVPLVHVGNSREHPPHPASQFTATFYVRVMGINGQSYLRERNAEMRELAVESS